MTAFCEDDELGYRRSATPLPPGSALAMDESYRLAHLPLVAPDHPRVIAATPARPGYHAGRHARVDSLVMPVPGDALRAAPGWRALEAELRAAPLAAKLAWEVLARRRDVLHATLSNTGLPDFASLGAQLAAIAPFEVELRGLFSGSVNRGRLYLRVHPERRRGVNVLQEIQRACGARIGDLWVVGVHNLTDDLDVAQTAALAALIARWWDRVILRMTVRELWLLGVTDDLALEDPVVERIPLAGARG